MDLSTIVYGVSHVRENAEDVISSVSKDIQKEDRVGIEVTPREIELYEQIAKEKLSITEAEEKIADTILGESFYFNQFKPQELVEAKNIFCSGHGFFFRIYQALSPLCAGVYGLNSRRSNILRATSQVWDFSSFYGFLRAYGCTESQIQEAFKCNFMTVHHVLENTHVDTHFIKRIKEENYSKAILGLAHAFDIKVMSDFRVVYLAKNVRNYKDINEYKLAIKRVQDNLREIYPEYGFLPDLTDRLEDAEKIKGIKPLSENEEAIAAMQMQLDGLFAHIIKKKD